MECVIFAGADISSDTMVYVPEEALIIAADSGYRHCLHLDIDPNYIVGDLDSISLPLPDDCEILRYPAEKDDTDLIAAINEGIKRGCDRFTIYGADGGRMGHTFAAIQTLLYIEKAGAIGVIRGSGFVMTLQGEGKCEYPNENYRYISLFSLARKSEVTAEGLKYGGDFTLEAAYPKGVSNEFTESSCTVTVHSGKILAVLEY